MPQLGGFKHKPWSPTNTEDGYIDTRGRFIVYCPDHPRASPQGYIHRSIVHYEYFNNEQIAPGFVIHHVDGNKSNDSKENLQKLSHGAHTKIHREKPKVLCVCHYCGTIFPKDEWRLSENGRTRGRYCKSSCYLDSRSLPENRILMKRHITRAERGLHGQITNYLEAGEKA